MRPGIAVLIHLVFTTFVLAMQPRVTFERVLPATHDLGSAEELAFVMAIGDHENVDVFVDQFLHLSNRSGFVRLRDISRRGLPFSQEALRRAEPADAYLAVKAFTCLSTPAGAEEGTKDPDGKRVLRRQVWIEATCTARVEILPSSGGRSSFTVKGDGASAHGPEITDGHREEALERAARRAAARAAEGITPRRVRESVPLDETAPAFESGMAMIESNRLADARRIWEEELKRESGSAQLHFNLAAVCEALGDRKAAEEHYLAARRLAPGEKRYSLELKMFQQRNTRP